MPHELRVLTDVDAAERPVLPRAARPMSRTDEVVDGIKTMILDGALHAGDRLPVEKDLAAALGVSRGSLREGVRALAILGILDVRQGDGTYVTSLDPSLLLAPVGFVVDLQDASAAAFHSVRRVLETEAAGLAALHTDDDRLDSIRAILDAAAAELARRPVGHARLVETDLEFHRAVACASANPVLAALVESLVHRTERQTSRFVVTDERVELRMHAEHEAILLAIEARDPDRARLRMASHLLTVEDQTRPQPTPPPK